MQGELQHDGTPEDQKNEKALQVTLQGFVVFYKRLVDEKGIEPSASALRTRRSPS